MNNNLLKQYICIVLLTCISTGLIAQNPIGEETPAIKVIGTVTKDAILLRWAPNKPLVWRNANTYGYYLERHTIVKDGVILPEPMVKTIFTSPVKPKPMGDWEAFALKNNNAAIAAQALYGETFDVEMENGGNGMLAIINQAQALEQRFALALYAADQDYEVAKFSGLAYEDKTIKQGERYLYKIKAAVPEERMKIEFGGIYIGLQDLKPLPKPQEFVGVFGDKNVMLTWNYKLVERDYNSYFIERSQDKGATFQNISNTPVTSLNHTTDRMVFVDSIPQNNKEYQYRIKGVSAFGKVGPASQIVKGKGVKALTNSAAITEAVLQPDNTSAVITWEFPNVGIDAVSHFELNHSNTIKSGYKVIKSIDKTQRTIELKNLAPINYYTITTVGLNGSRITSFPKMLQPVDDTPPAVPVGLTGVIDSTGIVTLSWQKNTEVDFRGYRVFRANQETEEFVQITFEPIPDSKLTDTINIKTLNKTVYYKVQAFDKRYNPSTFSSTLVLQRPDIIPPTTPVFKTFKVSEDTINLNWIASSSEDAVKTLVYRKQKGTEAPWELLAEVSLPKHSFQDLDVEAETTYLYTLLTLDASGLESPPTTPLTVVAPTSRILPELKKFTATVNREQQHITIKWSYNVPNVSEFMLYRSEQAAGPTLYKVFKSEVSTFTDKALTINTNYTYLLQAVNYSGIKSPMKKLSIKF